MGRRKVGKWADLEQVDGPKGQNFIPASKVCTLDQCNDGVQLAFGPPQIAVPTRQMAPLVTC